MSRFHGMVQLKSGQVISIIPAKLPEKIGVQTESGKAQVLYLTNNIDRDVPDYVPASELNQ